MRQILFFIILSFSGVLSAQLVLPKCDEAKELKVSADQSLTISKPGWYRITNDQDRDQLVHIEAGKLRVDLFMHTDTVCDSVMRFASFENGHWGHSGEITQEQLDGVCYCEHCRANRNSWTLGRKEGYLLWARTAEQVKKDIAQKQVKLEWHQKKYQAGDNIVLENILFKAGKAEFLGVSRKDLQRLYELMAGNPDMNIEIQGHVNAPREKNTRENQTLSHKRAKAVFDFLKSRGVSPLRMEFKGYGNTQMVFPEAVREDEMRRNRRVEIKVISNG